MYSEKVMDHFNNPRNVGEIENASGVGTVGNAKCGDIMRIYLDIDENQIIRDAKFKTFGCGAAVASTTPCWIRHARIEVYQRPLNSRLSMSKLTVTISSNWQGLALMRSSPNTSKCTLRGYCSCVSST